MVTVWTGGGVGVKECPKPIISALSLVSLEGFFATRLGGGLGPWESVWAKTVDAWHVLDGELRKEGQND